MRVFVVAGSPVARRPWNLNPRPDDYVIAADLGAAHAADWDWPVHLLIGDLDSLPAEKIEDMQRAGAEIVRAPAAKDETDTELALARALALGPEEIVLCAATGGRTDHLLANILLLARPDLASANVRIVDGGETLRLLSARREATCLEIEGAAGDLVSLLPLGENATGVTTEGLQYPLDAETLSEGTARGVSNLLTESRGLIRLERGRLVVIHVRMEER